MCICLLQATNEARAPADPKEHTKVQYLENIHHTSPLDKDSLKNFSS